MLYMRVAWHWGVSTYVHTCMYIAVLRALSRMRHSASTNIVFCPSSGAVSFVLVRISHRIYNALDQAAALAFCSNRPPRASPILLDEDCQIMLITSVLRWMLISETMIHML